jgi:hypothetical protein
MNMISMAQVVKWKTGILKVQGSHLTLQHFEVVLLGMVHFDLK